MSYDGKYYEIKNHYVSYGHEGGAVIYEPVNPDERAQTGILVMHSDADYFGFIPCPELAKRGFYVMAANVHESKSPLERKIEEGGFYLDKLREVPGIRKVILLGHSGGATLMSCYQAVAENGPEIFRTDAMIVKMDDLLYLLKIAFYLFPFLERVSLYAAPKDVLAKTEAEVKIMYLTEDNRIGTVVGKIPLVGFVDIPNVAEGNTCNTNYELKNIIINVYYCYAMY